MQEGLAVIDPPAGHADAAHRRNEASRGALFDRVLACHARLFSAPESALQAAAALGARGIERWQCLLRLDPAAGLEPQIAALFLDVERLDHLPSARRIGGATACQDDALRGTWVADELLADQGVSLVTRVRVQQLIRDCNGPQGRDASGAAGTSCELRLLREADTLSDPLPLAPAARTRSAPLPAGTAAAHPDPLADRVIGPSGVLRAIDALGRGRRLPSPATVMARSRLAVGMLGGAGLAPTRLAPLLARAEALGALGAPPAAR